MNEETVPKNENSEWKYFMEFLTGLETSQGGNSPAKRGIITTYAGEKFFIKIGVDEATKIWAQKEITAYGFLKSLEYQHAPALIAYNQEKTGFVIDALTAEDGWDWSNTWTKERLDSTLTAMDELAKLPLSATQKQLFREGMGMDDSQNGWIQLQGSTERQNYLISTFPQTEVREVLENLSKHFDTSLKHKLSLDTLVHHDVRADNCAWNKETKQVKLVDWNWLQIGDKNLDRASFLVHVHQNGIDVNEAYSQLLQPQALHFIAGFWLYQASRPIHSGGPETLRPLQLQSALTALKLREQIL
ncbi:MAG: hypothetical protein RLZZ76_101 [Candidatus Parcubacteria bacterium]|jgi:thiamine kinase-like enzyme